MLLEYEQRRGETSFDVQISVRTVLCPFGKQSYRLRGYERIGYK